VSSLKTSLNALLTPEESVSVLIDHQPFQLANLNSHEPMMIVNNALHPRFVPRVSHSREDCKWTRNGVTRPLPSPMGLDNSGLGKGLQGKLEGPIAVNRGISEIQKKPSVAAGI
jgi:hypothetical protein